MEEQTNKWTCSGCGKEIDTSNAIVMSDGHVFCKDCIELVAETCVECNKYVYGYEAQHIEGLGVVCPDCAEKLLERENYVCCDDCGNIINADYAYQVDDHIVCEDCIDNGNIFFCDWCDEYHYTEHSVIINPNTRGERQICEACFEEARDRGDLYRCDDCDEWFTADYIYTDDYDTCICERCFDSGYERCDNCGQIFWRENGVGDYCSDECYEEAHAHELLRHYHHSPVLRWWDTVFDSDTEKRYYGMELEIDSGRDRDRTVMELHKAINGTADYNNKNYEKYIYTMKDGSLTNGIEIISHPMTELFWIQFAETELRKVKSIANRHGYVSHNSGHCGLHFHVSRSSLSEETVDKMAISMAKFFEVYKRLSRRGNNVNYCMPYRATQLLEPNDDTNETADLKKFAEEVKREKNNDKDRYYALNTSNDNTIELRIYRGTLNIHSIMAAFFSFTALIEFSEKHTEDEILNTTDAGYIEYLTKYNTVLGEYVKKRFSPNNMELAEYLKNKFNL